MSRVFFALFVVLLRAGADAFCVPSHMCARVAGHRNAAPEMFDAAHAVDMAKVGFALGAGMTQYVKSQESMRAKLRAEEMYLQQPNRRQYVEQLERCFARRPSPRRRRVRGAGPKMIDSDIILGAGLLFGGTAMGAGVIAFVENQGQRTNDRGGMSDETKTRMAAMFMEDEELYTTDLDDTITKMEAALAQAEGREVVEGDGLTEKEKEALTDSWDD